MRKIIYSLITIMVLVFILPSVNVNAVTKTKTFTITESTKAPSKYRKLSTYNKNTEDYYVFKSVFEECAKNNGGKIVIKKGTYSITNTIYISSNTTVVIEDGATIKKSSLTGTSKLKASSSLFQLVNSKYASTENHYSGYNGEHDITILGNGTAVIDMDYVESSIGAVIGHTKNVTIKNIQFKNMNNGNFIKIGASDNTLFDGCTFENAKESTKSYLKPAINIVTPDLVTNSFNYVWSSHDKTPNNNIHMTNCYFNNVEIGVGTYDISKTKNPNTGLYDITQWQSNIKIDNCAFIGISKTCLRIYGWKDMIVENNEFCNWTVTGVILDVWAVNNPTFKHNEINNFYNIGFISSVNFYSKENGVIVKVPGQDYEPNYSYIYEQNIKDFYNNHAVNMDNAALKISKGITTSFPAADLSILGKEMQIQ